MSTKTLSWNTEQRKVSDLIPHAKNPRILSDKQRKDLENSIKTFSLVEIPAINTDNKIIAGHQRVVVLKLLGRENELIDVRVPNRQLTKKEYDQYLLSSNRIHGDWDWDLLAENFDAELLSLSGFDDIDLGKIFDTHLEIQEDDWDDEKELAKIKSTTVQEGDVYQLGSHRLICGDSTDPVVIKKLMGDVRADMINQDPPFNINLSYDKGVGGKKNKKNYGGLVDDNKTDEEYKTFIRKMMQNALSVAKKNCHVFYWSDERYVWIFQTLYNELGIDNRRLCIWLKNNASPTPQVAFNKVTEFCVYGTIGSPYLSKEVQNLNEVMNHDMTTGNNLSEEIIEHLNTWVVKRLPADQYSHPTQKSPLLHDKALRRCTKVGDVVLDLTAGSGSIMVACEQLKRSAYMCEKSPIFCQLILNHFKKISHEDIKKIN